MGFLVLIMLHRSCFRSISRWDSTHVPKVPNMVTCNKSLTVTQKFAYRPNLNSLTKKEVDEEFQEVNVVRNGIFLQDKAHNEHFTVLVFSCTLGYCWKVIGFRVKQL